MALEAVVYPEDPFICCYKDCFSMGEGEEAWGYGGFDFQEADDKALLGIIDNNNSNNMEQKGFHASLNSSSSSMMQHAKEWDPNSSPEACTVDQSLPGGLLTTMKPPVTTTYRRKRRRTKSTKNREEIENQRMTHIAVERNRRKQMNEYLAGLKSLMPPSYVQRGDQASIIGGAINFVKELEQLLRTMEAHNWINKQPASHDFSSPLYESFTFPQYSTRSTQSTTDEQAADQNQWAVADIEVMMVEGHANLKILTKKRPRQLLKMVAALQSLGLSALHLSVTAFDQMVLYSISVKCEEECHLSTVDEIAAAVNQMLHKIDEEAAFS